MPEPQSILIITGSPTSPSRTAGLAELVARRLQRDGFELRTLHVRDLPAQALHHADFGHPSLQAASQLVAWAQGVIVVSPVYKAAYTGTIKTFIDVLPQYALRDKVVLPLLVGGTLSHVLTIDYAVRPMLQSLDPRLIVSGLFVLDKSIEVGPEVRLSTEVAAQLERVTQAFIDGLRAHGDSARAGLPAVTEIQRAFEAIQG